MMPYKGTRIFSVQLLFTYENDFNFNFLKLQEFSVLC